MSQADLYCQVVRERYHSQEALNGGLHTRSAIILSFSGVLVGSAGIILRLSQPHQWVEVGVFAGLGMAFIVTVISCLLVLRTRNWHPGPKPADVADRLSDHSESDLAKVIGDVYGDCVEQNRTVLGGQAAWLQTGALFLGVQALLLVLLGGVSFLQFAP